MSKPLVDRIPFAKIITVLAIAFGVSLGLCGLNLVLSVNGERLPQPFTQLLGITSFAEIAGIVLSALGLVVTVILWVVLSITSRFGPTDSGQQQLYEGKDDGDKSQ
jgi:hypothetical protein